MKKLFFSIIAIFLAASSIGQPPAENYLLKDIGYIFIPGNMEIQSGKYEKFTGKYKKEYGKEFGYEISDNRIVFQQKGTNDNDFDKSFPSFAKVILETVIGDPGDYGKLTAKLTVKADEISQLSSQLRSQTEESFKGTGLKLIKWYGVQIVTVNGMTALKTSFLRQLNENPYVAVSIYEFHNNDRMHVLTLSYRQEDANIWKPAYAHILAGFKITNIR